MIYFGDTMGYNTDIWVKGWDMKLPFFWIAAAVSSILSADTTLRNTLSASMEVQPAVLSASYGFRTSNESEHTVRTLLNTLAESAKRAPESKSCKGGGIMIHPRYSYEKGKPMFRGYEGSLSYQCTFEDAKRANRFIDAIPTHPSIAVTQAPLIPVISPLQRQRARESLEMELLTKANADGVRYASSLRGKCTLTSIEFDPGDVHRAIPMAMMAKAESSELSRSVESPLEHTESIVLNASVQYSCTNKQ
jgi:uncharacterized protein YggE